MLKYCLFERIEIKKVDKHCFKKLNIYNIISITNLKVQNIISSFSLKHLISLKYLIRICYYDIYITLQRNSVKLSFCAFFFFLKWVQILTQVFIYALILFSNLNSLYFSKLIVMLVQRLFALHCNLKIYLIFICSYIVLRIMLSEFPCTIHEL